MIRLGFSVDLRYEVSAPNADFIFNVQAAGTRQQRVLDEHLKVSQPVRLNSHTDPVSHARYLRLQANPGPLHLHYDAVLELDHHVATPVTLQEVPISQLPPQVLPFLYPSRYCESDTLGALAMQHFGTLPQGYQRVLAVRNWVQQQVKFQSNSSTGTTSARDTLACGAGVCRDFAHVMIALCRALNIPARFSTGFDHGADPALGPPDFHAYVEAYVGHRWYLFDPSGTAIPMAFVRLATGHDAGDAAFATIFGEVTCEPPVIWTQILPDATGRLQLPFHTTDALSTDSGEV